MIERPTITVFAARCLRHRARGLIGRPRLLPGCGMLLVGVAAVHGSFIRWPLDLVFLDYAGAIVRCRQLSPRRWCWCRGAAHVIEMRAGEIERLGFAVGMRPALREVTPIGAIVEPDPPAKPGHDRSRTWPFALLGPALIGWLVLTSVAIAPDIQAQTPSAGRRAVFASPAPVFASPTPVFASPVPIFALPVPDFAPLAPMRVLPLKADTIRDLIAEAETYYRTGDDPTALLTFRSLAELVPEHAQHAWLRIGNIHQRAGSIGTAIEAYRKALDRFGDDHAVDGAGVSARRKALLNLAAVALEQSNLALAQLESMGEVSREATDLIARWRQDELGLQHLHERLGANGERKPRVNANGSPWQAPRQRSNGRSASADALPRVEYILGDPARAPRDAPAADSVRPGSVQPGSVRPAGEDALRVRR